MSLQENKATVRRFVEVVQNGHDLEALDEFLSPDIVDHSGMSDPSDLEGIKALFAGMQAAFPDYHFTIHQQMAEGDKVMTHKTFHGTHLGPFMGLPATGKEASFDLIDIFTVDDGKFTGHWAVGNQLTLLQGLGLVPAPG